MNIFWQDQPLERSQRHLLAETLEAHHRSAMRNNMSTAVLVNAGVGSMQYPNAVAAALLSIGGVHAPLEQTIALLSHEHPERWASALLVDGVKVPGWGNGFAKGEPDPLWEDVRLALEMHFPRLAGHLEAVTRVLHEAGRRIFPNPSAYTAATAIALQMPAGVAPYLFIAGRLGAWTQIFHQQTSA